MIARRVLAGAAAGVAGTALLPCLGPVERAIVGGEPPFEPRVLAAGLLRRFRRHAGREDAERLGQLLRWTYGPALGVAHALVRSRLARAGVSARAAHPLRAAAVDALTFSGAILAFELAALPLVAGARNVHRPRALAALALHVASFAAVAVPLERSLLGVHRTPAA